MPSEPRRPSRRVVLAGSALVVAASALLPRMPGSAQTDRGLLDLLFAVEQLQVALYEAILDSFDEATFAAEGLPEGTRDGIQTILEAEREHLTLLARPDSPPTVEGVAAAAESLSQTLQEAVVLENFATGAYAGIIPVLGRERLIAEVIGIHSVEARQAAWLSTLIDADPFPSAIDVAISPADVLARLERIAQNGDATPIAGGGVPSSLLEAIGDDLGVAPEAVRIVSVEARDWPDTALGCPRPGEVYAEVITPGFLIVVEADGETIEFHSDQRDNVVRCP
jgi:hypothetical protein